MRLGVLDVGSNTVHLLVVDAHPGARPLPTTSHKVDLGLAEHLRDDGSIAASGSYALVRAVAGAVGVAEDQGCEEMLAFATSAVREASNGEQVLARVRQETGVDLQVLSGDDEARVTFLAVRRWFGWSRGRLLVLDIGGGSLELAVGADEEPDAAVSLPLGASRLTRDRLRGDPPQQDAVTALRKHVRTEIARSASAVVRAGVPDCVVGTSKTIRSLARICGAAPSSEGVYVERVLRRADLRARVPELAAMTARDRTRLPGVSPRRAGQLLAGAVVIEGAMDLLGVEALQVCPWALREGLVLRRLDWLAG